MILELYYPMIQILIILCIHNMSHIRIRKHASNLDVTKTGNGERGTGNGSLGTSVQR